MTRPKAAMLLVCGVTIGALGVLFWPVPVVEAQTGWQCNSWTLQKQDTATAIGTWLGQSSNVLLTSAGIDIANVTRVIACKK